MRLVPIRADNGAIEALEGAKPPASSNPPLSVAGGFFIVLKWLIGFCLSVPVCLVAGLWFGVGGMASCVINMFKELRGARD